MKIDGKITKSFPINQGVRQGCVLSPLLFNIFMAELAKDLMALDNGLMMDNYKINSIFWADDIVLLCENGDELNNMIKRVAEYCKVNKLTINCKKTKCLIFNKNGSSYQGEYLLKWDRTRKCSPVQVPRVCIYPLWRDFNRPPRPER